MKKNYIMPQTQVQSITVSQLMVGSGTPGININIDPISGEQTGPIFGG